MQATANAIKRKIVLDPFCFKEFEAIAGAAPNLPIDKEEFTLKVNDFYLKVKDEGGLKDGYAPFCKHLFMENFVECVSSCAEITPENEKFLKSDYVARRENELPVLTRWFDKSLIPTHRAKYLDIILYSKDQIQAENKDMGTEDPSKDIDYDYGIISVKRQDVDHECPMQPITMMRNALGKEHGGSGVPLEFEKYKESCDFWKKHALIS